MCLPSAYFSDLGKGVESFRNATYGYWRYRWRFFTARETLPRLRPGHLFRSKMTYSIPSSSNVNNPNADRTYFLGHEHRLMRGEVRQAYCALAEKLREIMNRWEPETPLPQHNGKENTFKTSNIYEAHARLLAMHHRALDDSLTYIEKAICEDGTARGTGPFPGQETAQPSAVFSGTPGKAGGVDGEHLKAPEDWTTETDTATIS